MLESIELFVPDCSRTNDQLVSLIKYCQACTNYEPGGCTSTIGGDAWGGWRERLVSDVCAHWPKGIL